MNQSNPFAEHPPYEPDVLSPEAQAKADAFYSWWNDDTVDEAGIFGFEYIQELAELGHPQAQKDLILHHIDGYGIKHEYTALLPWFEKAAKQGSVFAQDSLAFAYRYELEDKKKAAFWSAVALEYGHSNPWISEHRGDDLCNYLKEQLKNGEITRQEYLRLLQFMVKEWDNIGAKKALIKADFLEHATSDLASLDKYQAQLSKCVWNQIPQADYMKYRKDVSRYCLKKCEKDLETFAQRQNQGSPIPELPSFSQEAEAKFQAGFFAEQEDRFHDAYACYAEAADLGHWQAAYNLVYLCARLFGVESKQVSHWVDVAVELGHPILKRDLGGILAMAYEGNADALLALSQYREKHYYYADLYDFVEEGFRDEYYEGNRLKAAAKDIYLALYDVGSLDRLTDEWNDLDHFTMVDINHKLYRYLWFHKDSVESALSKRRYSRNKEPYATTLLYKHAEALMPRLRKAGLRDFEIYQLHYGILGDERQEMERKEQEYQERIREERERYRQEQIEKDRAMQAYREKLDAQERVRNAFFGGDAFTDQESYLTGKQSANEYIINSLYREQKEEKYRKSLD